jgi:F0F1-type ATP synthase assembly protein I
MDRNQAKKEDPKSAKRQTRQSLNSIARYSGMAFQIAASIIICLFLGKWLDSKFPMKFPLFTTVLTILGVFLGVYFVIRDLLKQK